MMCERCGKNVADVFLVKMIGGKRYEEHICHECAKAFLPEEEIEKMKHMTSEFNKLPSHIKGLLGDMMFNGMFGGGDGKDSIPCPHCGQMISSDYIDEHMDELTTPNIAANSKPKSKKEILEERLERAVRNENYEMAADLRDAIIEYEFKNSYSEDNA